MPCFGSWKTGAGSTDTLGVMCPSFSADFATVREPHQESSKRSDR